MKRNSFLALALACTAPAVWAQNPPPAPPPPNNSSTAPVDGSVSSILDYTYNHKAGEGTAAKAGGDVASAIADKIKAVDVLNTPGFDDTEVRARFETYLSLKEVPDDRIKEYFGKMAQLSDSLKSGDTFTAWKLLYALSEYKDLDAGISRELATRIEGVWNSNRTQNGLDRANDKLRDNIETYDHNADLIAQDLHQQDLDEKQKNTRGGGGGGNPSQQNTTNSPLMNVNADPVAAEAALLPTMSGALQRKMEMTDEYIKMLAARAKIAQNEMRQSKMSDDDKSDFAAYIGMLYKTHRYYHVLIAADFYRALFNEGDNAVTMNKQANTNLNPNAPADIAMQAGKGVGFSFKGPIGALNQAAGTASGMVNPLGIPESDHPLSLSEQVTNALEINNRVSQAIEVFKYKADKGDIAAAADQLQQAYLANEFHPELQSLSRDEKEKVDTFLTKVGILKNQIEVRDFEQVSGQLDDIKKIAADFDTTKPMALVNAVKLESRLRLGKAKLLAQGGQLDQAMKEFQTAAEEWPGNPDLQTSSSKFFNTEDVQNESTSEFDSLVTDQNYRAIFEKQVAFAPAVKGDAKREQQLKDALEKVAKAEMAEQKANMLVMNGDVDGAWETIEVATKDWPDDTKLNKLLASLSGRGADFVSAINKARDAEAKKEYGYSLTWFVNAQSFYPASTIANEGIDRVSKLILSPHAQSTDSSSTSQVN